MAECRLHMHALGLPFLVHFNADVIVSSQGGDMQGFHILFALLCGKYQKNLQDGLVGNLQRGTLSIKKTIAATSIASGPPDAV